MLVIGIDDNNTSPFPSSKDFIDIYIYHKGGHFQALVTLENAKKLLSNDDKASGIVLAHNNEKNERMQENSDYEKIYFKILSGKEVSDSEIAIFTPEEKKQLVNLKSTINNKEAIGVDLTKIKKFQ